MHKHRERSVHSPMHSAACSKLQSHTRARTQTMTCVSIAMQMQRGPPLFSNANGYGGPMALQTQSQSNMGSEPPVNSPTSVSTVITLTLSCYFKKMTRGACRQRNPFYAFGKFFYHICAVRAQLSMHCTEQMRNDKVVNVKPPWPLYHFDRVVLFFALFLLADWPRKKVFSGQ